MDKTDLVARVASLMTLSDHDVQTSVVINFREIDVVAVERFGISRKTILIECADYGRPVGIPKLQQDLEKLNAAQSQLGGSCTIMHVSSNGYSQNAAGYARQQGLDAITIATLAGRMVNFDGYITSVTSDPLRDIIVNEYQPTRAHFEGRNSATAKPAMSFLKEWLASDQTWLTVLGDYGVGKSWMLKRLLYELLDEYLADPNNKPMPVLIPLQRFFKSFDLSTLVTTTLQHAGVRTVNYGAFEQLASMGRIVYLLDSFDEMAQTIRADTIRENLAALLVGIGNGSKAIMTSRPNYFESRAERLMVVEKDGAYAWEPMDELEIRSQSLTARLIEDRLASSSFARLNDLTNSQRTALFKKVLVDKPNALKSLDGLFARFQGLESVSQRAVIARLLTSVAETLAGGTEAKTPDGTELLPADLEDLNEGKIFQLVVHSLLTRDLNSGGLKSSERHRFLLTLAVFLQKADRSKFASPVEVHQLVDHLFMRQISSVESPEAIRENYYRTCRRHSGLTTEGQFRDTSGAIDTPVDETDSDSAVGFSHNALREYIVAEAAMLYLLHGVDTDGILEVEVSDAVSNFFVDQCAYTSGLLDQFVEKFAQAWNDRERQFLFRLGLGFIRKNPAVAQHIFGVPPSLDNLDLSSMDLSGLDLTGASFNGSLLLDTDFRKSVLRGTTYSGALIELAQFDGADLRGADFQASELISIFVDDQYVRGTSAVLPNRDARQWLFASDAAVDDSDGLNPYLGQMWYTACRELARTLVSKIAGTHQSAGLVKGTKLAARPVAADFRDFLVKNGHLIVKKRNPATGNDVLQVQPGFRPAITAFAEEGQIDDALMPFFAPLLEKRLGAG